MTTKTHFRMMAIITLAAASSLIPVSMLRANEESEVRWRELAPPVVGEQWVRPDQGEPARPVWGHADGLRVGIAPMPGPRGLLRIYAPYLGHPVGEVINYIAVEPIPVGESHRGYSELEWSELDETHGKRFWSVNQPGDFSPRNPARPASGVIIRKNGVEMLRVFILVEPFQNGAQVYLRLTFREDRPYEVGIATFAQPDSEPLKYSIVTATMGNKARLRRLHLKDGVVLSTELWPAYRGDGFARRVRFGLDRLIRTEDGGVIVAATPNDPTPQQADYAPGTHEGWHYSGQRAIQYWRFENPPPELVVAVNGRFTYWGSDSPIPGGVSYENFELIVPFRKGREFWFGVRPWNAWPPAVPRPDNGGG